MPDTAGNFFSGGMAGLNLSRAKLAMTSKIGNLLKLDRLNTEMRIRDPSVGGGKWPDHIVRAIAIYIL